jgi:glucuronoxylan 4-O-methyltransferase
MSLWETVHPVLRKGKRLVEALLAAPSLKLAALFPNRTTIGWMCWANRFLTSPEQVDLIRQTIQKRGPCNLLIFGLGHDSEFYRRINQGGRTVFLENDEAWVKLVMTRFPHLEAYLVHYKTTVAEWEKYLKNPEAFTTTLPSQLNGVAWDIIFVDAPLSWKDFHPGRMESIRLASTLIHRPGDVFVHDCERRLEDLFTTKYLSAENLREEVGNLRHYGYSVT